MEQSVRLGRIGGIPLGMNWSVLVIFFLIAWELSALVLPADAAGSGQVVYWVVGVSTALLFYVSLLAHETAHALLAKRNGIGVRRITLWLFGGVSELEGDALTPGADFRIAVVGPLTSFVLSGVFGALAALAAALGSGVLEAALGWLAWMNLLLGGFNMIPAAPLDGGRVLRAGIWHFTGDRTRAAVTASRAGVGFGYALVGLGVITFIYGYLVGLWFAFLGWFLISAARAEEGATVIRSTLAGVRVRDIMTADPVVFEPATTVSGLVEQALERYHFTSFPIAGPDRRPTGLATLAKIRRVPPLVREETTLAEVATPLSQVPLAHPDDPLPEMLERMQASPDGRALVLGDDGELVGIVSPSDISRYLQLCMLRASRRPAARV
ncbi:MAG: site-2 protease family protein [Actinomycetota bacterium]|nr:site-2 protease family protein [Actinomycetota bacterium]